MTNGADYNWINVLIFPSNHTETLWRRNEKNKKIDKIPQTKIVFDAEIGYLLCENIRSNPNMTACNSIDKMLSSVEHVNKVLTVTGR